MFNNIYFFFLFNQAVGHVGAATGAGAVYCKHVADIGAKVAGDKVGFGDARNLAFLAVIGTQDFGLVGVAQEFVRGHQSVVGAVKNNFVVAENGIVAQDGRGVVFDDENLLGILAIFFVFVFLLLLLFLKKTLLGGFIVAAKNNL